MIHESAKHCVSFSYLCRMRAHFFLGIVSLFLTVTLWGQVPGMMSPAFCPVPPVDSTLVRGEAARDNLWPGFGTGSRRQSDMDAARAFRTADILGLSLTGVGVIGVAATALQRGVMGSSDSGFGPKTNAPYYIFGGIAVAGIATITTSRILAVRKAREYDLILFPASVPGGAGVGVNLQF